MPEMLRHCRFRRSSSDGLFCTGFLRSRFSDVIPQNTHNCYSTIASSSSQSPWYPLIRIAIAQNDLLFGESIHAVVMKRGHTTADRFLTNNLINMYSKCGSLNSARQLFDVMPHRDLVTWNSILAGYAFCCNSHSDNIEEGFRLFRLLRSSNVSLTKLTFAPILKLCSMTSYVWTSESVHGFAAKIGLESEMLISGALVNIYIKFGKVSEARIMFNHMKEYDRDVVLWNMMLRAYVKMGLEYEAFHFLSDFHHSEVVHPDIDSLQSVLSGFARDVDTNRKHKEQLQLGEQIHGMAFKSGFYINVQFSNSLNNMYLKMGCLTSATRVFVEMEKTDVVSWNSMINSYVQSGLVQESFDLYIEMLRDGLKPDQFTLASVLRSCSSLSQGLYLTEQIHAHAMKNGLGSDIFVSTTLVDSYSKNEKTEQAESLFLEKDDVDLGLWNVMMFGYIISGNSHKAWELFTRMHKSGEKPDGITLATMAKDCGFLLSLKLGGQIHGYAFKLGVDQDLYLSSSLLDMYIKCGEMEDAHQVFDEMLYQDEVSWTSIISGCRENGDANHAIVIYHKMRQSGLFPDEFTFATLIKACSYSTALEQGRQIHANAIKSNCGLDAYVSTSLIDFYSKCGNIEESFQVFKRIRVKNIVLWNAMLLGLAQYGNGKEALNLFNDLKFKSNLLPDRVTFIGVL